MWRRTRAGLGVTTWTEWTETERTGADPPRDPPRRTPRASRPRRPVPSHAQPHRGGDRICCTASTVRENANPGAQAFSRTRSTGVRENSALIHRFHELEVAAGFVARPHGPGLTRFATAEDTLATTIAIAIAITIGIAVAEWLRSSCSWLEDLGTVSFAVLSVCLSPVVWRRSDRYS